jgi:hypothetical protein
VVNAFLGHAGGVYRLSPAFRRPIALPEEEEEEVISS